MKNKLKKLWMWLRKEVLNKQMIIWVIIAELIFWSPLIFCFVCAFFNPWWWTGVSAILLFWTGPFTPAVPLQIGLAICLKKFANCIKSFIKRRHKDDSTKRDIATRKNSESNKE